MEDEYIRLDSIPKVFSYLVDSVKFNLYDIIFWIPLAQELGSATVFQADNYRLNQAYPPSLLNAQGIGVAQLRRVIYRLEKQKQAQQKHILHVKDGFLLCVWKISLSPEASQPKHPQSSRSTHPAHDASMSAWMDPGGEDQSRAPLTTSKTHLPKE